MQHIAAVVVEIGRVGLERDRLIVARERLVEPAGCPQGIAEVGVDEGKLGTFLGCAFDQLEGCVDQSDRLGSMGAMGLQDAVKMQAVEMPGLDRERAPVKLLGLREQASLMERQRLAEDRIGLGAPRREQACRRLIAVGNRR